MLQLLQLPQFNHLKALGAPSPSHPLPPCRVSPIPPPCPRPVGCRALKHFYGECWKNRIPTNPAAIRAAP